MKSIILAAGEGTRLRPYTLTRPKCMVEVAGRSLIDRQLDILKSAGITENIVIGGYLSEKLKGKGSRLLLNPEYNSTNMVWTLFCAENEMEGDIIVTYGDIVYSKKNLETLLASEADIAVTIDLDWEEYWRSRLEDPLEDAETMKLGADGRILELGQKPESLKEIEGQYMGLMKFSKKGVEMIKKVYHEAVTKGEVRGKPVRNAYMTDLLQLLIDKGVRIDPVPVHSGWVEIDTVEDLNSEVTRKRLSEIG